MTILFSGDTNIYLLINDENFPTEEKAGILCTEGNRLDLFPSIVIQRLEL
jgi:hypothetical protein